MAPVHSVPAGIGRTYRRLGLRLLRLAAAVTVPWFLWRHVLIGGVLGDVHQAVTHGRRSGDVVLERWRGNGCAVRSSRPW